MANRHAKKQNTSEHNGKELVDIFLVLDDSVQKTTVANQKIGDFRCSG